MESSPTSYNRNDADADARSELYDLVNSFSSTCASKDNEAALTEPSINTAKTETAALSTDILASVASCKDTEPGHSMKGSTGAIESEIESEMNKSWPSIPPSAEQNNAHMVGGADSKVENGGQNSENGGYALSSTSPTEDRKSLDIPSLKSSNSFRSQKAINIA